METLSYRKVTQGVENTDFDCGNSTINQYIKNSYFPVLTQQAYAYSVLCKDNTVGYYMVMFREIDIHDFPDEISDYEQEIDIKAGKISSLHIHFLAVHEKLHDKGIGTGILKTIISNAYKLVKDWPIRVITIDSVLEYVNWYEKRGFKRMVNNIAPGENTIAMYYDCMLNQELLDEYVENMI